MDYILSLIKDVALMTVKVTTSEIAKHLLERLKGRTAPTTNRDGSDSNNK